MRQKIYNIPADSKFINHTELRSDMEREALIGETLVATGKICESPETWALDVYYDEVDSGNSYLYESESDFLNDFSIIFK